MKKLIFALLLITGMGSSIYSQCSSNVYPGEVCNGYVNFWFDAPFFSSWNTASIDCDFGDGITQHDTLPHIDTVMTSHTYASNGSYTAVFNIIFYDTLNITPPCSTNVTYTFNITTVIPPPTVCAGTFVPMQYCMDSIHFEPDYGAIPCNYYMQAGPTTTNLGDTLSLSPFGLLQGTSPWPTSLTFNYSYMLMGSPMLQCSTTVPVSINFTTYQLDLLADTSAFPTVVLHDTSSTNMVFSTVDWGDGVVENIWYQSWLTHDYFIDGTYTISASAIPASMYNYFLNDSMSSTCETSDAITIDVHGASNSLSCNLVPVVTYDVGTQILDFKLLHNGNLVTSPHLIATWNFNNGMNSNLDYGTLTAPVVPTSFTVNYVISDFNGNQTCTGNVTNSINSIYPACNAVVYIYEDSITPGIFWADDQSSGGLPPYSYLWDFGDGDTSSLQYPTHTYAVPGIYMICLTIMDSQSPACMSQYCDTADARVANIMFQFNVYNPTTGVEENNQVADFNIYPNPVSDVLTLNMQGSFGNEVLINVYNIAGELISTQKMPSKALYSLDVSNLSSGLYFLHIGDGKYSKTKKFIKH